MLSSLYLSWVFGMSTDVEIVWSVIILLCCGLAFTAYCVIYILRLAYKELEEDGKVRKQGQEGEHKAEPRECHSEES